MRALLATFIMTFPDSVPKFTITQCSLGLGNVMTVMSGSHHEQSFHQQGGPKEHLEGRSLWESMGLVVETRDWGYQMRVHGASMINDPHTTMIILQLHMPIMQKANHLRRYPNPSRLGVRKSHCNVFLGGLDPG